MSGQLQFGGTIPFPDRQSGGQVQVRVWGVYVGHGVDAHEQQAIQQWIMNALANSAMQYDGNVHELPHKAAEWGGWVSQQIAPGLAQNFQAQGQIQIQGVQIEGAAGGKPMGQQPMQQQGNAYETLPGTSGDSFIRGAADMLSSKLDMNPVLAWQAASMVMLTIETQGGSVSGSSGRVGSDHYAQKKVDPYAHQKKPDPYAHQKKQVDPYAQKKQAAGYEQKKQDPYAQQKHAAPAKKGDYKRKADPYQKAQPAKGGHPQKKADPWKK